jgi:predicted nucleic acid-binding Zn ribbon protein
MESHSKCPNCGRSITENELYCYFYEMDLSELDRKNKKESGKKQK